MAEQEGMLSPAEPKQRDLRNNYHYMNSLNRKPAAERESIMASLEASNGMFTTPQQSVEAAAPTQQTPAVTTADPTAGMEIPVVDPVASPYVW